MKFLIVRILYRCGLLLKFYFLISEPYFLKASNESCTNKEMINTADECSFAVWNMETWNKNFTFLDTIPSGNHFKGCFRNAEHAWWNPPVLKTTNDEYQPICKKGK